MKSIHRVPLSYAGFVSNMDQPNREMESAIRRKDGKKTMNTKKGTAAVMKGIA
jgi:hypothetical protein